jgi:hypothetical protein
MEGSGRYQIYGICFEQRRKTKKYLAGYLIYYMRCET